MTDDLSTYDDRHLECRDLRHAWKVIGWYRKDGNLARDLRCTRCTTVRHDVFGYTKTLSYDYPDGYHMPGKFKMDDFREEVFHRAVINDEKPNTPKPKGRKP